MHGVFQIALSVLGDSFNKYLTRKIGDRAHSVQIVYYFAWVSAATLALVSIFFSDARPNLDTWNWTCTIYTLTLAICGSIGTCCQIRAVQLAKAGRISLLFYIQMPLTMTLSYIVFGDALNALGWTGSLIIVGTSLAVAFSKDEDSHPAKQNYVEAAGEDEEENVAMMEEPTFGQPLLGGERVPPKG